MDALDGQKPQRRNRSLAIALAVGIVVVLGGGLVASRLSPPEQDLSIPPGADPAPDLQPPAAAAGSPAAAVGPPFVTAVSENGRYFVDQYGQPVAVRGDSPWSLMTDLAPGEVETYLANRADHGVNSLIVSLIGAVANGGPADDGSTFDGIAPFVDGDLVTWNEAYFDRAHDYLQMAADRGMTVFLYPIDGWTVDHAVVPESIGQCAEYGQKVGERFADLANLVWMTGGDYFPITNEPADGSDVDHCFDAMLRGIRAAGSTAPFSIQLGYEKSVSTDNPYWARRVDWNFAYSYYPTYRAVLDAYGWSPAVPAVFGEGNFERENNQADSPPTTNETLRRQVLWALTSGAAGEFYGSDDWEFQDGWAGRLDTDAVRQISDLRDLFAGLRWWDLVPDEDSALVTAGRGEQVRDDTPMDVLDSDYVTAARTPDGTLAVVYVPTARTITLDLGRLDPAVSATWIDPASGTAHPVAVASSLRPPGTNDDGDEDWLLLLSTSQVPG
ncbi:DUF4038 domain-containing protein [Pengzhenrongella frigida]|uniref:apiosidase-like domain-containing protein n=1 Tax=Pengzhenrongella frigida TaxID=1259133 RepID=UPI0013EDA59A|nr:DUF4038 domain-containing protein [Cellulomonas sp. HLT2-17]